VKFLSTLGLLGLTLIGLIIAIPVLSVAFSVFGALIIFFIWIAPFWIIATSEVTQASRRSPGSSPWSVCLGLPGCSISS
jgi:hypothetical protein